MHTEPPQSSGWTRHDAAELLDDLARDPALRSEFRIAYRGRHDPLDSLAWFANPGAPGPSGATDPSLRVPELERGAYGRPDPDTSERDQARSLAELAALLASLDFERKALETAMDELLKPPLLYPPETAATPEPAPETTRPWFELPWVRLAIGSAAAGTTALAVALAAQTYGGQEMPAADPFAAAADLVVFERAQTAEEAAIDLPITGPYPPSPGSIRILGTEDGETIIGLRSIIARDDGRPVDAVCRFVIDESGPSRGACLELNDFAGWDDPALQFPGQDFPG